LCPCAHCLYFLVPFFCSCAFSVPLFSCAFLLVMCISEVWRQLHFTFYSVWSGFMDATIRIMPW
jgi:hypothetical protein